MWRETKVYQGTKITGNIGGRKNKYVFYCTWFCKPFWRKEVLPEGDNYNPFFRKKSSSQGDECCAKIDIYIRKPDASATKDEYLHYDPPLPCVIEIAGQHNHALKTAREKAMDRINDKFRSLVPDNQAKREIFKYFQMGLSPRDARKKFTLHYRSLKPPRTGSIPTYRQTEMFFNEWEYVKNRKEWQNVRDCWNGTLKEWHLRTSEVEVITFKEFLDAIPKREIMYPVKHLDSETDISVQSDKNAPNQDIKFPLVFVSVGFVAGMPNNTASLLYKLKHDYDGEFVSNLVRPRIYSLYIESENSSEPVSNEILGIPASVEDSRMPAEATTKYVLDIPIKLEPLNDGYEDVPSQGSTQMMEDSSILPTPTLTFPSEGATAKEINIEPNICSGDSTTTEEIDIKPNICKAGNSFFPLMFTLKGSVHETSKSRSLVYDLKQSSYRVQASEAVIPQIYSVQINSLSEAAFQLKDGSILTAEGSLNITIQTELLEVNSIKISNERVDHEDKPVIIKAFSCRDHFPVITENQLPRSKDQRKPSEPGNAVNKPMENKRLKTDIKQEGSNFNMGFFTFY